MLQLQLVMRSVTNRVVQYVNYGSSRIAASVDKQSPAQITQNSQHTLCSQYGQQADDNGNQSSQGQSEPNAGSFNHHKVFEPCKLATLSALATATLYAHQAVHVGSNDECSAVLTQARRLGTQCCVVRQAIAPVACAPLRTAPSVNVVTQSTSTQTLPLSEENELLRARSQVENTMKESQAQLYVSMGVELMQQQMWAEAFGYMQRAAQLSEQVHVLYNLAICYAKGYGVRPDLTKAVQLWTRAAEKGHVPSMYQLGVCHARGWGTAKNMTTALGFMRSAANAAMPEAQVYLAAACIAVGNYKEADEWGDKVRQSNSVAAKKSLRKLLVRDKQCQKRGTFVIGKDQDRSVPEPCTTTTTNMSANTKTSAMRRVASAPLCAAPDVQSNTASYTKHTTLCVA